MLSFVPGDSFAHRLDSRSKLCFQAGFAVAALAADSVAWLVATYLLTGLVLFAARLSPVRVARDYRVVLGVLAVAPVVAGLTLGPPWFRVDPASTSLFAVLRVPPVLAVSAAYVWTTPVRDTRAAIQRLVPGRTGQLLGVGVGLVFRFFPLVVSDLRAVRTAMHARGGERRPFHDRARRLFLRGLGRTVARADRLAVALRARCFAWNPTLPALAFDRADYPVALAGVAMGLAPAVRLLV